MKKTTTLYYLIFAIIFISCGSGERSFERDYVVVNASQKKIPDWIDSPTEGDTEKEIKNHRYFVNESSHKSKRLCVRSAEARATARIAQEIAQFMKNTFAEATQGGEGEEVTEYMQEQLAQEAQSFIVGASVHRTYWEKRRFKEELGAKSNKTKYYCYALVKMSKKNLQKAVERSQQKLLGNIQDPEVKKKTDKILKDVGEKFNEVSDPVKLENNV